MTLEALGLPAEIGGSALALAIVGALLAGFTSGFAGFGTGLTASGIWFHALPAPMVPLLIALTSVASQLVSMVTIRQRPSIRVAGPMLAGGVAGLPVGIATLAVATPLLLKASVGGFLVAYVLVQSTGLARYRVGAWGGPPADAAAGAAGGFLAGFCGLSGPVPIIWLQLRGGPVAAQRAIYQPFNLIVLTLASVAMLVAAPGLVAVLPVALVCLPATMFGAYLGARAYGRVSEQLFRRIVLALLMASGLILVAQALPR